MRKTKFLLLVLLSTNLAASTTIKHTLLMPRPIIDDLPMEKTGRHNHAKLKKNYGYNFHMQAAAFTKQAINGNDVGKYFGFNGTNNINVYNAENAAQAVLNKNNYIWTDYLIHDYNGDDSNLHADFNLNPKQEVYGVRIDLFGMLNNPIKKSFFKISMPVVYVENDFHVQYNTNDPNDNNDYISEFFQGGLVNANQAGNLQDRLTYAKIENRRRIAAGIADIDAHLGYRLVETKKSHFYVSGLITIPTGNRPKGEHLFEPIYGNGNHFAIGLALDSSLRLWKKKRHCGSLEFALTYKYLFDGKEKRTIPLNFNSYPYAHYYLSGVSGQAAGTALFPAANVLTQDVRVRPGNILEGMLGIKFKTRRFLIDAGYNLFFKEKESLTLKNAWTDDYYAIALSSYDETEAFSAEYQLTTINNSNLDIDGAATPNQLTHKAYANIGYKFNISKHPASIDFGGGYEFAQNNFELEGYEFWLKGSLAF